MVMNEAFARFGETQPVTGLSGTNGRERLLLVLATAFVILGAVVLHLAYAPFDARRLAILLFAYSISFLAAHLTFCHRLPRRDPLLLPTAALLSGWGLLILGRVAPNFLPRQATWLMVSMLGMLAVAEAGRDLRWLRRYRYTWLVAGLAVLAATLLLGVNPSGSGPRLWLAFGDAYFQPSELLKLLMVVFLASYLADRRRLLVSEDRKSGPVRLPNLAYVGPLLAMFGLAVLLLAAQQDLGAAMLFFFTFLSMLYLATGQWGYVGAGLVLFGAAGVIGYVSSTRLALRVEAWLQPWAGAADWAFQIVQSLLAFGTGGILGQGLGLGQPTFIPAVHTDFTFAALGESFGLLGILAVIALYGVLLLRGFRAAARVRRPFEGFLSAGLTAGLVIQAWVIMGASVRLAPIAGVTLPFLSYGGSSLLSTFLALGLVIRVSNLGEGGTGAWGGGARRRSGRRGRGTGPLARTAAALVIALALLAVVCGYWTVVRADWLVAREDNPRRVLYEQRIVRGRILDRDGEVLADVEVGPGGVVMRTYPVPEAAPVVGYANLRYGTGGIEAAFDEELRGEAGRSRWEEAWADLLHRHPHGEDVKLALDADLQRLAQEGLGSEAGAAVLLDVATGQVLAMASAPTFDPARLEEMWEALREDPGAPLLNRATQGLYQPGAALQSVVVAEALSQGLIEDLEASVGPGITKAIAVDGASVACTGVPEEPYTLASAYAAACPAPIGSLGERLGRDGLAEAVQRWRLTVPPRLPIPTEAADWRAEAIASTRIEAIGQGMLTVSPLEMALVTAALANNGNMPVPQLVLGEAGGSGDTHAILASDDARELLGTWRRCGDVSSTGGGARGHWGTALGGEGEPHAWFMGTVSATGAPVYAAAVLIERAPDPERAVDVGVALLQTAIGR
jgi:peptidoglycan glycosyltransferase